MPEGAQHLKAAGAQRSGLGDGLNRSQLGGFAKNTEQPHDINLVGRRLGGRLSAVSEEPGLLPPGRGQQRGTPNAWVFITETGLIGFRRGRDTVAGGSPGGLADGGVVVFEQALHLLGFDFKSAVEAKDL